MSRFNLYIIVFGLFSMSFAFSQSKNEKEERVNISEFPEKVQTYFNTISSKATALKFYRETDGDHKSFEAKFKFKKQFYSLEFDTKGVLEDIEIVTKKKHIEKHAFKIISHFFDENFNKTRFIKIQKQYKNNTDKSDQEFILHIMKNESENRPGFEIIAEVNEHGKQLLKEFTFNSDGQFVKSRIVVASSYEYVLY